MNDPKRSRACDRCGARLFDDCRCAPEGPEWAICPACGYAHEAPCGVLGTLGNRTHYRCRACGAQWSTRATGEE